MAVYNYLNWFPDLQLIFQIFMMGNLLGFKMINNEWQALTLWILQSMFFLVFLEQINSWDVHHNIPTNK